MFLDNFVNSFQKFSCAAAGGVFLFYGAQLEYKRHYAFVS
jgi:hypothetical protein